MLGEALVREDFAAVEEALFQTVQQKDLAAVSNGVVEGEQEVVVLLATGQVALVA